MIFIVGPYDKLGEIHMALGEYVEKNGYEISGAPLEIYFNCLTDVSESELLSEDVFLWLKNKNTLFFSIFMFK